MKLLVIVPVVLAMALTGCASTMGPKESGGTLIGGATGAVLGAQVGHGTGRLVGVAVGTLAGALIGHRVALEGTLLKPNMVLSGKENARQAGVSEVAEGTVRCLRRVVPSAVPGIVFLSGGQTAEQATEHLSAMNALGRHPWELSFSYGRALQDPVLKAWRGNPANVPDAQGAFYHRAMCNGAARHGKYTRDMEKSPA